ncbi:MAG: hypothetical protein HZA15_12445 [Nitrospirae bacterium]|nr:hypothetical protein [Nitrospirota bacterium]
MKGIISIAVTQFLLTFLLVLSLFGASLVFSDEVQRAVLSVMPVYFQPGRV